jgi:N-acetylglutamate synthase-like GNAT family acetyltransferase
MESNKQYFLDWEFTYNLFSKKHLHNPMINYWSGDKVYTQTNFFYFGFITFTIKEDINETPYIRVVYILQNFRNKKIGINLVKNLLENYKQQGYKKVCVEPTIESVFFWEKLGFKKGNKNKFFIDLWN